MKKEEFFKRCKSHDWYYNYSDDFIVWAAGERSERELLAIANQDPELNKIFNAWGDYVYGYSREPKMEDF
jgi:hypothetical protein